MTQFNGPLSKIYKAPLGMLTDLYQFTMAAAYFDSGMQNHEGVFNLHFRRNPFKGGFSIASGMAASVDFFQNFFKYESPQLDSLSAVTGNDGRPLFKDKFLYHLHDMKFSCDVDMVDEGSAVFPMQAFVRVRGSLIQGQLAETPLLCMNNFGTLIATKTARTRLSCGTDPLLDFGLRRAQGIDGSLQASYAAYIGGTDGTSNVLAGQLFGIPIKGTFAHSWVMSFKRELDSFFAYAKSMPNNCTFLVDTYNTEQGIRNAIEVGLWLKANGYRMAGVRLDSGNLGKLSKLARRMLDDAGLVDVAVAPAIPVVGTNDLDEYKIARLKLEGAKIGVWGVGTMMITAFDQPALGGVYKLAAIRGPGEDWRYCVKLSEDDIKVSIPGMQRLLRYSRGGEFVGDVIYDELRSKHAKVVDLKTGREYLSDSRFRGADCEEFLHQAFRAGELIRMPKTIVEARQIRVHDVASLPAGVKKLSRPARYPIYLESELHTARTDLIAEARAELAKAA